MSGPYIYVYVFSGTWSPRKPRGCFLSTASLSRIFLFKRAHRFEVTVESTENVNISHGMGGGGGGGACGPCDPPV